MTILGRSFFYDSKLFCGGSLRTGRLARSDLACERGDYTLQATAHRRLAMR
jgi:hypothetical protein